MSDQRLLRIIVEETVRSPNRQAELNEVRGLYGNGFEVALGSLRQRGYIAENSLHGHIALTAAGIAAAQRAPHWAE